MNNLLPIVQRVLALAPIPGKGRLADLLLKGEAKEVTCHPLAGVTLHLNPQQRIERLMWAGAYEPDLVRMLKSFLKPGMVFLDLGANVGYFSAISAALVGVHGRVFAFEPAPNCFTRLQRNLSAFPQAFVYHCAASDRTGQTWFYLHSKENGWGSLFNDEDLRQRVEVNTIRLDDWARDAAIERLDFLKIDIEGGEYGALLGAQTLLKRFHPVVIAELNSVCLSRDQRTPDDVLHLLAEAGYHLRRTDDSVIATPQTIPAVVEP